MAGNGHTLVRPKQFVQNPLKIAAGSPLAIQGIFLEILRERFSDDAGLGLVWRADLTTTDIVIETSYNLELEAFNQAPAIYVSKLQTVPGKVIVGDRVGVRLPDHLEGFGALSTVGLSIECVSNDEGESAILGDLVQFTILAAQDIIQREFGLYDISHPTLGPTTPFVRDQNQWATVVEFSVQFWIRWSQVPIAPLLQQIAQRVSHKGLDASGYFIDATINSFKRGEVFDPTTLPPGEELPPSRISIVGPQGPQGPAGPPGVTGAVGPPGPSFEFWVDQPLIGAIDGINTVYTASTPFLHNASKKEMFYVNGVRQRVGIGNDYTVAETVPSSGYDQITMVHYAPRPGDILSIDYYPDV